MYATSPNRGTEVRPPDVKARARTVPSPNVSHNPSYVVWLSKCRNVTVRQEVASYEKRLHHPPP